MKKYLSMKLNELSTNDIMFMLNKSRSQAWRIKTGKASVSIEEAYLLAQYTNTDLDDTIKYFYDLRQKEEE